MTKGELLKAVKAMIDEAQGWRVRFREKGQSIEAAACAIRVKALQDVIKAIELVEVV